MGEIRRRKSEGQKPLRTPVARLAVAVPPEDRALVEAVRADLAAAGFVQQFEISSAPERRIDVELAAVDGGREAGA